VKPQIVVLCGVLCVALSSACERETRRYKELPAAANRETGVRVSQLEPGMPQQPAEVKSPYQENAWGISEGQRLYQNFNCVGCHSHGGGGMGPALMDESWIYGSDPDRYRCNVGAYVATSSSAGAEARGSTAST